ncbi:MAG: hypothetical protein KDK44_04335, partial [Chlamydiia bacterium]|nr:hypothetical protein [Chlamydiia bacterium]
MVIGLTCIRQLDGASPQLAQQVKDIAVILPLPGINGIVERTTLLGRLCVMVEAGLDYVNPKWTKHWWLDFFEAACQSDDLSTEMRYNFYTNVQAEKVPSTHSRLKAVPPTLDHRASKVEEAPLDYAHSIFRESRSTNNPQGFDTPLFRGLFDLNDVSGETLFSTLSYSLDCLEHLAPQSRPSIMRESKRVADAHDREKSIAAIIAQGRKPKLREQASLNIIRLAKALKIKIDTLPMNDSVLFRGGCGSSNQLMRQLMHEAFIRLESSSINKDLDSLDLSAVVKNGYILAEEAFGPEAEWDKNAVARWLVQEFLPDHLGDFESAFNVEYVELLANLNDEEMRQTFLILQGCGQGQSNQLKEHLTTVLLKHKENAYGHLLSDGVFERFFDDCSEKTIRAIKEGSDYLPDELKSSLLTFIETGTFNGLPEHVREWLPKRFSEEFAKNIHTGLLKILADDLFPADLSRNFILNLFESLDDKPELESAFRTAFSELIQTNLINKGFEKYSSEFSALFSQMPVELRE